MKNNYNIDEDIEMLMLSEKSRNFLKSNYFLVSLAKYNGVYNIND